MIPRFNCKALGRLLGCCLWVGACKSAPWGQLDVQKKQRERVVPNRLFWDVITIRMPKNVDLNPKCNSGIQQLIATRLSISTPERALLLLERLGKQLATDRLVYSERHTAITLSMEQKNRLGSVLTQYILRGLNSTTSMGVVSQALIKWEHSPARKAYVGYIFSGMLRTQYRTNKEIWEATVAGIKAGKFNKQHQLLETSMFLVAGSIGKKYFGAETWQTQELVVDGTLSATDFIRQARSLLEWAETAAGQIQLDTATHKALVNTVFYSIEGCLAERNQVIQGVYSKSLIEKDAFWLKQLISMDNICALSIYLSALKDLCDDADAGHNLNFRYKDDGLTSRLKSLGISTAIADSPSSLHALLYWMIEHPLELNDQQVIGNLQGCVEALIERENRENYLKNYLLLLKDLPVLKDIFSIIHGHCMNNGHKHVIEAFLQEVKPK